MTDKSVDLGVFCIETLGLYLAGKADGDCICTEGTILYIVWWEGWWEGWWSKKIVLHFLKIQLFLECCSVFPRARGVE